VVWIPLWETLKGLLGKEEVERHAIDDGLFDDVFVKEWQSDQSDTGRSGFCRKFRANWSISHSAMWGNTCSPGVFAHLAVRNPKGPFSGAGGWMLGSVAGCKQVL
jgi:hypothetical protein